MGLIGEYNAQAEKDNVMRENQRYLFSRLLLNGWQWSTNSSYEKVQRSDALRIIIVAESAQQVLQEEINQRSRAQWALLFARRFILILLNLSFLGGTCYTIVLVNRRKSEIVAWATNLANKGSGQFYNTLANSADLAPTVALSMCNAIIGPVTYVLVNCASWDYRDDAIATYLSFAWIGKTFNLLVVVWLNYMRAANWSNSYLPTPEFNKGSITYECREDESSYSLLTLVALEAIGKVATYLAMIFYSSCVKKRCLKLHIYKNEFDYGEEAVWLLYFLQALLFSVIYYPYMFVLQPLILVLVFQVQYHYLTSFCNKPISQTNKEALGSIIAIVFSVSMLIYIVCLALFIVDKGSHATWVNDSSRNCGPLLTQQSMQDVQNALVDSNAISSSIKAGLY